MCESLSPEQEACVDVDPQIHVIYPKALIDGQLYGHMNPESNEWIDGLLANILLSKDAPVVQQHRCSLSSSVISHVDEESPCWLVFDGALEPSWLDNLNSVLEDSMQLSLASGSYIRVSTNTRLIFETTDLMQASPVITSRLGIVHLPSTLLSWQASLNSRMTTLVPDIEPFKDQLEILISQIFSPCLLFVLQEDGFNPFRLADTALVDVMVNLLTVLFQAFHVTTSKKPKLSLECAFLLSVVWSIGTSSSLTAQLRFDQFVRLAAEGRAYEYQQPSSSVNVKNCFEGGNVRWDIELMMPLKRSGENTTIYEWLFCPDTLTWIPWMSERRIDLSHASLHALVVPTVDMAR